MPVSGVGVADKCETTFCSAEVGEGVQADGNGVQFTRRER